MAFPGGPVVKNPPCNAGDTGLIPGWGTKIPYATEQLSPRTTNYRIRALQGKIPDDATKTQRSQINLLI